MSLPAPYYQDDAVTIYHGDCTAIMAGMETASAGMVFADPPYGVGYAEWDRSVPDMAWLDEARRISWLVLVTPGNRNQHKYPPPSWTMAWARPGSVQRADGGGFSHWEPILLYGSNPFDVDCRVFPPSSGNQPDGHPCPKPRHLLDWLISGSKTIGTIIDPFCGSGTTLVSAKDLGRKAIGIEIEERYCEIAARRCAQEVMELK